MLKVDFAKVNTTSYDYLLNENLYLVYQFVQKIQVMEKEKDRLIQVGLQELIKTINEYNLFINGNFTNYALMNIIKAIKDDLNKLPIDYVKPQCLTNLHNLTKTIHLQSVSMIYQIPIEEILVLTNYLENS